MAEVPGTLVEFFETLRGRFNKAIAVASEECALYAKKFPDKGARLAFMAYCVKGVWKYNLSPEDLYRAVAGKA